MLKVFTKKMRVIVSLMSDTTGRWKIRWQFGENIYLTVGYWLQYIKSGVEISKLDIYQHIKSVSSSIYQKCVYINISKVASIYQRWILQYRKFWNVHRKLKCLTLQKLDCISFYDDNGGGDDDDVDDDNEGAYEDDHDDDGDGVDSDKDEALSPAFLAEH